MLKTKEKLGEIVVKSGLVSKEQLEQALEVQRGITAMKGSSSRRYEITAEIVVSAKTAVARSRPQSSLW